MINVTKTHFPPLSRYTKYLKKIWKNNWISNEGEFSVLLKEKLEKYLGVKNLSLLVNGTIAMQIVFKAMKLKGEVITTSFTFPATTNALIWEGLKPVFVDIDPETFNIDPDKIEERITKETTAILAVHVFGNPCDVEAIEKIAKKHNLNVIYDSAHAFGIEYKGKSILSWGDASTLSLHAAKIFHTAEGGAAIVKKRNTYSIINLMKNHGIKPYVGSLGLGTNAKLNELQAAMGLSLLPDFAKGVDKRMKIYRSYVRAFSGNLKFKLQKLVASKYTYPYFPICFDNEKTRDRVYESLLTKGIAARKYFFPPCHELPIINPTPKNLPVSTKVSHSVLCLPIYEGLPMGVVKKIIRIVINTA